MVDYIQTHTVTILTPDSGSLKLRQTYCCFILTIILHFTLYRSRVCVIMIPVFLLLLLLTSNSLALDEEQRDFIITTIQELSRKASNGEPIPADNPLSVFLLNVKTEASDDGAEQFPGHPVIHFLSNGLCS